MTKYFFYYAHNILIINKTIFPSRLFTPIKTAHLIVKKGKIAPFSKHFFVLKNTISRRRLQGKKKGLFLQSLYLEQNPLDEPHQPEGPGMAMQPIYHDDVVGITVIVGKNQWRQ